MGLLISFLTFVGTSTALFHYFKCDTLLDINKSFLKKDYSVDCESGRFRGF